MTKMSEVARAAGCLLGLAVGDAVGTTLEFKKPGSFEPISDMVGGGPFRLPPGYWTDDTSMALCLADSLLSQGGFDAKDQMERYFQWNTAGLWSSIGRCFDIGTTVRGAIVRYLQSGEPYAGSSAPDTAGNGSLMRLAPIPLAYSGQPAALLRLAAASSRTTHGARTAVDACRYYAGLISGALQGLSKEQLLSPLWSPEPSLLQQEPLAEEVERIARGSFKTSMPPQIRGTGYVVDSLEAALWAFFHSDDFRSGCLMAANLGEDADTTAAIYGQLAGAYYGKAGIDASWLERLHLADTIEDMAVRLWHGKFAAD